VTGTAYDRVLRAVAAAGAAGVSPGELPGRSGLGDRQARRAVAKLTEHGLAERDAAHGRVRLTPAGREAAGVLASGEDEPASPARPASERDNGARLADVGEAIASLPGAHQAMIRLLLAAACARHHLRGARPSGHLGGIAAGDKDTRTGKTLIAHIVCAALGLDPVACVREVAKETELSLWGRRVASDGGRYALVPADVLAFPFVALDELDKASGKLKTAALRLLQGDARIPAEGQIIDIAPVVYATSNAGLAVLPPSYRRRSVCLDTTGFPPVPYQTAKEVLAAVPRLPLGRLAPPAAELPDATISGMDGALRACLTDAGWQLCDLRDLELAALGWAGLAGDHDLPGAAFGTVLAYLECTATTGEAHPDWRARLDRWLAGEQVLPPATIPADTRQPADPQSGARRPEGAEAILDHSRAVGAQAAFASQLRRASDDLDQALRDARDTLGDVPGEIIDRYLGIRDQLDDLRQRQLSRPHPTKAGLLEVTPAAQEILDNAADLQAAIEALLAAVPAPSISETIRATLELADLASPARPGLSLVTGAPRGTGAALPAGQPARPGPARPRSTQEHTAELAAHIAAEDIAQTEKIQAAFAEGVLTPAQAVEIRLGRQPLRPLANRAARRRAIRGRRGGLGGLP
jgi:hypothetical protein